LLETCDPAGHLLEEVDIEGAPCEIDRHGLQPSYQTAHDPAIGPRPVDAVAVGVTMVLVLEPFVAQEQLFVLDPQPRRCASPFLICGGQIFWIARDRGHPGEDRGRHIERVGPPPDERGCVFRPGQIGDLPVQPLTQRHQHALLSTTRVEFFVEIADRDIVGVQHRLARPRATYTVVVVIGHGAQETQRPRIVRHARKPRSADVKGGCDPVRRHLRQVAARR